jgi:hypothetical protein
MEVHHRLSVAGCEKNRVQHPSFFDLLRNSENGFDENISEFILTMDIRFCRQ